MCRWNRSITTAATFVTGPPSPSRSSSGTPNSTTVPACASVAERREGRRSSGKSRWNRRLMPFDLQIGLLLSIAATTNGKCRLSLEVAAPHQIATMTSMRRDQLVAGDEQVGDRERPVDLGPGGQEDHLVAQPDHGEDTEDDRDLPARQGAVRRHDERHQQRGVQDDVDDGPRVAAGQRHPPGPRGQPDGARPQPVEERAQRRGEPQVERAEAAAEAEDLEEHRPEHELVEQGRRVPPGREGGEAVDARGGQEEQPADEGVEHDLDEVDAPSPRRASRSPPRRSAGPAASSAPGGCRAATRRGRGPDGSAGGSPRARP